MIGTGSNDQKKEFEITVEFIRVGRGWVAFERSSGQPIAQGSTRTLFADLRRWFEKEHGSTA